MSVESPGQDEHWLSHLRGRFKAWRGGRPFWAGVFTIMGAIPIGYVPYHNFQLGNMTVRMATTAGAGALIIGVLLLTLGLTMWFHSIVRVFAGVAAIVLALVSLPVSNFGGLVVGFLFAMVGGALSISWAPGVPDAGQSAPQVEGPYDEHHDDGYVSGEQLLGEYTEPTEAPEAQDEPHDEPGRSSATISVTKAPGGSQYA
ncbi:DUF6114 domain-containing protein [Streptomyces polyrhachis]|uniref:DUF6114 domain-containing protein n=1 Tax=Streptomyces polyrhachis TaxID=1282885 RepID=A0ABW2GPF0_9ACTN